MSFNFHECEHYFITYITITCQQMREKNVDLAMMKSSTNQRLVDNHFHAFNHFHHLR